MHDISPKSPPVDTRRGLPPLRALPDLRALQAPLSRLPSAYSHSRVGYFKSQISNFVRPSLPPRTCLPSHLLTFLRRYLAFFELRPWNFEFPLTPANEPTSPACIAKTPP